MIFISVEFNTSTKTTALRADSDRERLHIAQESGGDPGYGE